MWSTWRRPVRAALANLLGSVLAAARPQPDSDAAVVVLNADKCGIPFDFAAELCQPITQRRLDRGLGDEHQARPGQAALPG